jgi:glucose-1-phosphate adenylyltransferase
MLDKTLTFILAGGAGTRLAPLTNERAKPAVPFGGKYRIIDFTLTNCLHSGLHRVLVLTQYKSHSLQKHLRDGWSIFNPELGQFITTVPAQMRKDSNWYKGTADAIYQNIYLLERSDAEWVVILSGDHIYRMDYATMLKTHCDSGAVATIACMEVELNEASAFGVVEVDTTGRITGFEEKPAQPKTIPDNPTHALASMGVYIFSRDLLIQALNDDHQNTDSNHDFGKDILPKLIREQHIQAHRFGESEGRVSPDRYWRDVGTIDSFFEANMDLLNPVPSLDLYQTDWPIRTYQPQTPPARTVPGRSGTEGVFINSILGGGSVISGAAISRSILFPGVFIADESLIQNAILFHGVRVGENVQIQNAIIDKDIHVPDDEEIGVNLERDRQRFTVSEKGIVVVPKGYRFE